MYWNIDRLPVNSFILLFVAYGTALDPIQGEVFGPVVAPFFIGGILGMNIFVSGGVALEEGYTGAGMNPARCFGPAIATGEWV